MIINWVDTICNHPCMAVYGLMRICKCAQHCTHIIFILHRVCGGGVRWSSYSPCKNPGSQRLSTKHKINPLKNCPTLPYLFLTVNLKSSECQFQYNSIEYKNHPRPCLALKSLASMLKFGECSHSSSQDKFDTMFKISLTLLPVPVNIGSGTNIIFQYHILLPHSSLIIQSHIPAENPVQCLETPYSVSLVTSYKGNSTITALFFLQVNICEVETQSVK